MQVDGKDLYLIMTAGAELDPDSLVAFCKQTLAPYKAPKAVEFVDSLPRAGLGKIDRGRLTQQER